MLRVKRGCVFLLLLAVQLCADQEFYEDSLENPRNFRVESARLPDEELFLDPYVLPFLQNLEGQALLDAGCGDAYWTVIAAENGAIVDGLDPDKGAIDRGTLAVLAAGMGEQVTLIIQNMDELPYPDKIFDRALSINIGCRLPSAVRLANKIHERKLYGLRPYMKQVARVLKTGGLAIVTAPASFGVVFTDGTGEEEAKAHIQNVLQGLGPYPQESEILSSLNQLEEVLRATFVMRKDRLELETDEERLKQGEEIWRKLPGAVMKNWYHPEAEYFKIFKEAKMEVAAVYRPKFLSEEARDSYNLSAAGKARLGPEYVSDNPFVIYWLKKEE